MTTPTHRRRYPRRPILGVGAVVIKGSRVLLVERAKEPLKGWWSLPGGVLEAGERLADGICREVQEETGLELTHIFGLDTRVESTEAGTNVECLAPLAAYQTLQGPVDSLGVYFRCRTKGQLIDQGDETEAIRWIPIQQVAQWLREDASRFAWVDRAGLLFYFRNLSMQGEHPGFQ